MIIFGLGPARSWPGPGSRCRGSGRPACGTTQQGSWPQWYQDRPIAKRPLSQITWATISKPIRSRPAATSARGRRRARRSRPRGRARGRTPRTSRRGCRPTGSCSCGPRSGAAPVCRRSGSRHHVAASPSAAHVRLLGRAEGVVHAVAPGRVEADAVGRDRSRGASARAPSSSRATSSGLVASPHSRRWSPSVPQLARLDVGLLGWLGHVVGVGQARPSIGRPGRRGAQEPGVVDRDVGQEGAQLLVVPAGHRADRVEGREDERLLLGVEVDVQDRHGRLAAAERERHAGVAVDDEAGAPVDEDLLDPAHLVERAGEGVLLRLRMDPPVRRVGEELVGRLLAGAGDPVAPGRGRGRGDARLRRHRATPDLRPCIVAPPE